MSRAAVVFLALSLSCQAVPNVEPPGPAVPVFDDSFIHEIEIEVAGELVSELRIDNDERVPCTFTFDGQRLETVGIRLKGNFGSGRDIATGKTGFSVKFNEFVSGQRLGGLKKLILNNEVQDNGFIKRRLGYEIWRRAGVPAPQVAYARITFNGEYFGLYTMEEAYGVELLARWFDDPGGNLYEGNGADISNVDSMDLDTNEDTNERSDLAALAEALTAPDEGLLVALSAHVDLEQFMAYWAVERLLYHYDGYGTVREDICCSPNNYYAYYDPGRAGFVFLPRGADTIFLYDYVGADVGFPPREKASLAWRLFNLPEARAQLAAALEQTLQSAWDIEVLEPLLDELSAQALEGYREGGREETDLAGVLRAQERTRAFLLERPVVVRARLAQGL
jgi:spore coat protein H